MTMPRVITESLGGGALALAAQRGERHEWYRDRPLTREAWRAYMERVSAGHTRTRWLERLLPSMNPTGAALERLRWVSDRGGVVVSTGQQAALFGGPLYTLIKAISALGIADVLQRETGIATAPVFWAATDDADYEEANWAAVALTGELRRLRLPPLERSGIPMSAVPMPNVERLVDELAAACGSAIEPAALDIVRESYSSRTTLGNAYVRHLRAVLEPLGIAVLDASHPALPRAAEPVLVRALEEASGIEQALRERYDAVLRAGYTPQVEHVPALSLVFAREAAGEKRRIPVSESREARWRRDVTALGPNVLLRPLVERFLMPSAAYVAGPGEISYFAQLSAIADLLQLETPLVLPRWSATILEPRIERLLDRLGATREELRQPETLQGRLARQAMPAAVEEGLRKLRTDIESGIAHLAQVDRDNLVPAASLEGLRRALSHRMDRTERRYLAGIKRRETELLRDIATAVASLYPEGKRQERMLNFVPFLARYGQPVVDLMRAEAGRYATDLLGMASTASSLTIPERV